MPTTLASRRRNPNSTQRTVLNSDTNSDPSHDTLDFTHLLKNIDTKILNSEQETFIAKKHIHVDDKDNLYNVIALPTESVTENLPFPESVMTITTQFPSSYNTQSPSLNQVKDFELLNDDIVDSVTAESVTELSNNDYTTIANDLFIESSGTDVERLSKNDESFVEKTNSIAPRPFSLTTSPPFFLRNTFSVSSPLNQPTWRRQSRPSIVKTTTEIYSSHNPEEQQYTRRPTVSFRPGYRGTARFKFSSTKSGEYDPQSINGQFIEDNRLRSLNLERPNKRPPTTSKTPPSTTEDNVKKPTRRRPMLSRTSTTEQPESSEQSTPEYRIIEAKNKFNLKDDNRPDKLRFELTAGGKINFGFSSVKSRENSSTTKIEISNPPKIKVITGPLDRSPIVTERNYKKGFVEEIPIQTSPQTITIKSFSGKLDLNEIPLQNSEIESFVLDDDLRNNYTTELPFDDDTTVEKLKSKPTHGRFVQRQKSLIDTETMKESYDEIASQQKPDHYNFSTKYSQKLNEENEKVPGSKYLTRVRVSDVYNRRENAIGDSENSETQDVLEESTLRTRVTPNKGFILPSETGEFVTENSIDIENEFYAEENDDETTFSPIIQSTRTIPHRLTIRKRPAKKIDFHATRQTITESAINKDTNGSNDNDIPTTNSFENESENIFGSRNADVSTRPTRARYVTQKLITDQKSEATERPSLRTTKKRVLVIRTKSGVIKSEVDIIPSTEEPSTDPTIDDIPKNIDSDVTRRRIKFVRLKTTTEKKEKTTHKSTVTRTRVFRRPTSTAATFERESLTTPRSSFRLNTRRRVVKVNKKPVEDEANNENHKSQVLETISEISATAPRKSYKVLKQKTPRVIHDKPLEENSLVGIKIDEQNQQIDTNENEEAIVDENSEVTSGEPISRPVLRYPTRSGGKVSVNIHKRPFSQGSRISTVHPTSTRLTKDGIVPTRPRVTIRRKFKPSSSLESTVPLIDEIDYEKRVAFVERNKKIFKTKYRKISTSTSLPNITLHNSTELNTEYETSDYEELPDSTDIPINNNDGTILQPTTKPRFSLKTRFTASTTAKPTTLQHVFAIDEEDEIERQKNGTDDNSVDKVIEKLQKLIEINRIVEVYSKKEIRKSFKNKKLKSIKEGELTVERPPVLDKFSEISRQVVIKLKKKPLLTTTTQLPEDVRSPKNAMFAETVFSNAETSTISLEGLFEREKKKLEVQKQSKEEEIMLESNEKKEMNHISTHPLEKNPIVISLSNLDQVILSKVQPALIEEHEDTTIAGTTEHYVNDETTTLLNDD